MSNLKHITPSGVEITDNDLKSIQKATTRDNLKTGLAIVGAAAIVFFVRGMIAPEHVVYTPNEE